MQKGGGTHINFAGGILGSKTLTTHSPQIWGSQIWGVWIVRDWSPKQAILGYNMFSLLCQLAPNLHVCFGLLGRLVQVGANLGGSSLVVFFLALDD